LTTLGNAHCSAPSNCGILTHYEIRRIFVNPWVSIRGGGIWLRKQHDTGYPVSFINATLDFPSMVGTPRSYLTFPQNLLHRKLSPDNFGRSGTPDNLGVDSFGRTGSPDNFPLSTDFPRGNSPQRRKALAAPLNPGAARWHRRIAICHETSLIGFYADTVLGSPLGGPLVVGQLFETQDL